MSEQFEWFKPDQGENIEWFGEPKLNSIYPILGIGILLIPFAGIGLVLIAVVYLHLKNTDYVVTNKALYKKTGILSRKVKRISYDKIQDTSYSQGIFGTYFDYGDVKISTAGGRNVEMVLRAVDDPREVQERVDKKLNQEEVERSGSADEEPSEVIQELRQIRSELEEINSKLE